MKKIVSVVIVLVDDVKLLYRGYEKKGSSSRSNIKFVIEKLKIKFSIEIN